MNQTNDIELDKKLKQILSDRFEITADGMDRHYRIKTAAEQIKQEFLGVFLELVGEKNVSQIMRGKLGSSDEHVWCVTRNELRAEFVAAANKRLGVK